MQKLFSIDSTLFQFIFHFTDFTLETVTTRFARLMAEYSSFQAKVKQRISKLEKSNDDEES